MRKTILIISIFLSISFISKGQKPSLPFGLSQKEIITLMTNPREIYCKWDTVYSTNNKLMGYTKTIEITPKDTSLYLSIFFSSNTIKKIGDDMKLWTVYAEVDAERIHFFYEGKCIAPELLKKMSKLLQTIKARKAE